MGCNVILENRWFRLTIGADCIAKSLLHKSSGQECLVPGEKMALFSVTEPRPFKNTIKLAYPSKRTVFQANRIRREGNRLIIGFELIHYEAVVEVKEEPDYISFRFVEFIVHEGDYPRYTGTNIAPIESFRLLQLPIKKRKNFGDWLNVVWDDAVAVNVLATSPYPIIDAEDQRDFKILTADALRDIKVHNTEVALIVADTSQLLDIIDRVEHDYHIPLGVKSRRGQEVRLSQYWASMLNPGNVDEHIRYCKQCGYQMMTLYYEFLINEEQPYIRCGDYDEDNFRDTYPEGFESLRKMVKKIKDAGIIPGVQFVHPHIGLKSKYVTPVADHRLHKRRYFTLAQPLDKEATTVYVEENPEDSITKAECRVLQFGGELISYEDYTTEWPYCFTGCERGHLDTYVTEHPLGLIGGILDVSEYGARSCYVDQNSSLQDEIAAKIAKIYSAGFEYVYWDGSEGVIAPFAFHVSNSQYRIYKLMEPAPLMGEGSAKTHFSWHILSGGNAFDIFKPELFKEKIRELPFEEAARMRQDFTRVNFGWWGIFPDLQPDHWEYGNSLAAAWDCPATFKGNLGAMASHPRTNDLLEVMRRWEDVRLSGWLTDAQKQEIINNPMQERILLINEDRDYELVPYAQITTADETLRAFAFERNSRSYIVYWHTQGEGR